MTETGIGTKGMAGMAIAPLDPGLMQPNTFGGVRMISSKVWTHSGTRHSTGVGLLSMVVVEGRMTLMTKSSPLSPFPFSPSTCVLSLFEISERKNIQSIRHRRRKQESVRISTLETEDARGNIIS